MTTDLLSPQVIRDRGTRTQTERMDQYTLWQILGIWALGSLFMALLTWIVAPIIILYSPLHPGITYWLLMIASMGSQSVVCLVIIYRELGTLRWSASASVSGCKMHGVFGKYDRVANAVLFGLYPVHKPWMIFNIIVSSLAITWPAKRFRSSWMASPVHGVGIISSVIFILIILLGLGPRWDGAVHE